jgi:hypothetical protein
VLLLPCSSPACSLLLLLLWMLWQQQLQASATARGWAPAAIWAHIHNMLR